MKGNISQWNDAKGFGFITVPEKNDRLFFHISSVKTRSRRPEIGDSVEFEIGEDRNGKLRATSVVISGLTQSHARSSKRIIVDPPKMDFLDFTLPIIIISSSAFTAYQYYLNQGVEKYGFMLYRLLLLSWFLVAQKSQSNNTSHVLSVSQ